VAGQALAFAQLAPLARPALVSGAAGFVVAQSGRASVARFTVSHGTIAKIDLLADSTRPRRLDLTGPMTEWLLTTRSARCPFR
jgi:hypothetical protein